MGGAWVILPCGVPCCMLCWFPEGVALLCPMGVVGGVDCGDPARVSTSMVLGDPWGFSTKYSLIKDEPIMVVVCRLWHLNCEIPETPPSNGGRSKKFLDRRGLVGSVMVSTSLILEIFLVYWDKEYYYQIKYDHIYKTKWKIKGNFSFRLMLCDQASKKYGLVVLCMILKNPKKT